MRVESEIVVDERVNIPTADGATLVGTLYRPSGGVAPKATVQIHGALGVRRGLYRHFARYLATQGFAVLAFDLRGTGDSRPRSLRGFEASFSIWGQKDMPAALDWMSERFPGLPSFVVGHSLGGQLTGLMPNHELLSGVVLLFAGTGYVFAFDASMALQGALYLYVYLALAVRIFGYGPCRYVTNSEDLPAGVVREWTRWSRSARWMSGYIPSSELLHSKFKLPLRVFALEDDRVSPPRNCEAFVREYYRNANAEYTVLPGRSATGSRVSHFGYFSAGHEGYWHSIASWLERQLASHHSRASHDPPG